MKLSVRLGLALALVSTVTLVPSVMAKSVGSIPTDCPLKIKGQASDKSQQQVASLANDLFGSKKKSNSKGSAIQ